MDKSGNKTYAKVFDIKQRAVHQVQFVLLAIRMSVRYLIWSKSNLQIVVLPYSILLVAIGDSRIFEVVGTQVAIKGHTQSEVFVLREKIIIYWKI